MQRMRVVFQVARCKPTVGNAEGWNTDAEEETKKEWVECGGCLGIGEEG